MVWSLIFDEKFQPSNSMNLDGFNVERSVRSLSMNGRSVFFVMVDGSAIIHQDVLILNISLCNLWKEKSRLIDMLEQWGLNREVRPSLENISSLSNSSISSWFILGTRKTALPLRFFHTAHSERPCRGNAFLCRCELPLDYGNSTMLMPPNTTAPPGIASEPMKTASPGFEKGKLGRTYPGLW